MPSSMMTDLALDNFQAPCVPLPPLKSKRICSGPNCTNTSIDTPDKIFFKVPDDPVRRETWKRACNRNFPFLRHAYICEDHFEDLESLIDNYVEMKYRGTRPRLSKNAVPTKFECEALDTSDVSYSVAVEGGPGGKVIVEDLNPDILHPPSSEGILVRWFANYDVGGGRLGRRQCLTQKAGEASPMDSSCELSVNALFACGHCDAHFLNKMALLQHMSGKGRSWSRVDHGFITQPDEQGRSMPRDVLPLKSQNNSKANGKSEGLKKIYVNKPSPSSPVQFQSTSTDDEPWIAKSNGWSRDLGYTYTPPKKTTSESGGRHVYNLDPGKDKKLVSLVPVVELEKIDTKFKLRIPKLARLVDDDSDSTDTADSFDADDDSRRKETGPAVRVMYDSSTDTYEPWNASKKRKRTSSHSPRGKRLKATDDVEYLYSSPSRNSKTSTPLPKPVIGPKSRVMKVLTDDGKIVHVPFVGNQRWVPRVTSVGSLRTQLPATPIPKLTTVNPKLPATPGTSNIQLTRLPSGNAPPSQKPIILNLAGVPMENKKQIQELLSSKDMLAQIQSLIAKTTAAGGNQAPPRISIQIKNKKQSTFVTGSAKVPKPGNAQVIRKRLKVPNMISKEAVIEKKVETVTGKQVKKFVRIEPKPGTTKIERTAGGTIIESIQSRTKDGRVILFKRLVDGKPTLNQSQTATGETAVQSQVDKTGDGNGQTEKDSSQNTDNPVTSSKEALPAPETTSEQSNLPESRQPLDESLDGDDATHHGAEVPLAGGSVENDESLENESPPFEAHEGIDQSTESGEGAHHDAEQLLVDGETVVESHVEIDQSEVEYSETTVMAGEEDVPMVCETVECFSIPEEGIDMPSLT